MSTTEIEKTNLEAHAELCAERYINLQDKLENLDTRMDTIECNINEIKTLVSEMKDQRNKQLIGWGVGIIGTLIGAESFLVYNLIKLKS
jgi:tetrahydromethanopterin S-methyltransferase subunit G